MCSINDILDDGHIGLYQIISKTIPMRDIMNQDGSNVYKRISMVFHTEKTCKY